MQTAIWRAVLGVEKTVIEDVEFDEDQERVVVSVRPVARSRDRCGRCRRRCRGYDQGRGERRRWRALDLGRIQTWLEADSVPGWADVETLCDRFDGLTRIGDR